MTLAWMRMLALLRDRTNEGEGGTGGDNNPPPRGNGGNPPANRSARRNDDEDEDDDDDYSSDGQIRQLRRENKRRRLEARDLERKLKDMETNQAKAIEDAVTAAIEKASKDADKKAKELSDKAVGELRKTTDERLTRAAMKLALKENGVVDEETGLKLIDQSGIKVDDAGDIVGVAEAVAKLKEGKPFLFSTEKTTTNTSKAPNERPADVKDVRKLSDEEYAAERRQRFGTR